MNKIVFLIPAAMSLAAFGASQPAGPLAKDQDETRAQARMQVKAADIKPGAKIPSKYSAYANGISPSIAWSQVPNAKSYALIVEDPDAPMARPFVHWLAWNIPASTTRLQEGQAAQGAVEGRNGQGKNGYFGPKPPAGDPDHHY